MASLHGTVVTFVLAGGETGGSYAASLRQLARSFGLDAHVVYLGFVSRAELPRLYTCMDVVLFTSVTEYETFGIVNLVRVLLC
jgi:glycosyltransferase involved in cell wall biosynthesis